jgi:hypothetical protein
LIGTGSGSVGGVSGVSSRSRFPSPRSSITSPVRGGTFENGEHPRSSGSTVTAF